VSDLNRETQNAIKGYVNRHNILTYEQKLSKYDTGKNKLQIFITTVVYSSQTNQTYSESIGIKIKTNLTVEQIRNNRDTLIEICKIYYAKLDYPDFIELTKNPKIKVIDITDDTNPWLGMEFEHLNQLKLGSLFVERPNQFIEGWGKEHDEKHIRECVIIFLINNYHVLVDKGLIKDAKVLTADYIIKYFESRGGYTLLNLKEFVIHLKYANLRLFNQSCNIELKQFQVISKYGIKNAILNDDFFTQSTPVFTTTGKGVLNCIQGTPHLECVTEPNIYRSLYHRNDLPKMFNITQALTDAEDLYDYEFFDNPDNLILNDDYNE
jgi:hypothetical protein